MEIVFLIAGISVGAFIYLFGVRVGSSGSRPRMMDDPDECRKMVDHYQRLYDKSINHIRLMYDVNENAARLIFRHDTADEAVDGDGVHQDFRDSVGFWRIQAEDAERRVAKR